MDKNRLKTGVRCTMSNVYKASLPTAYVIDDSLLEIGVKEINNIVHVSSRFLKNLKLGYTGEMSDLSE